MAVLRYGKNEQLKRLAQEIIVTQQQEIAAMDDPTIRPTKHIFVGSKALWFTITDDLPQYQEL